MVDSSSAVQSNVDVNKIATDLNNKADRDLVNLSNAGRSRGGGFAFPSNQWLDIRSYCISDQVTRYFTAPKNGYINVRGYGNSPGGWLTIQNTANGMIIEPPRAYPSAFGNAWLQSVIMPVCCGHIVAITLSSTWISTHARFIYAQGET